MGLTDAILVSCKDAEFLRKERIRIEVDSQPAWRLGVREVRPCTNEYLERVFSKYSGLPVMSSQEQEEQFAKFYRRYDDLAESYTNWQKHYAEMQQVMPKDLLELDTVRFSWPKEFQRFEHPETVQARLMDHEQKIMAFEQFFKIIGTQQWSSDILEDLLEQILWWYGCFMRHNWEAPY
jgi:hypothetical protein